MTRVPAEIGGFRYLDDATVCGNYFDKSWSDE